MSDQPPLAEAPPVEQPAAAPGSADVSANPAEPPAQPDNTDLTASIRAQVEAEQALADAQRRVKALEQDVARVTGEKQGLEGERDAAVQSTNQLRTQLSTLQSTHHKTTSELSVLQTRVDIVEREKKELLEETDRLQERSTKGNQDLYTLRAQKSEMAQKIAHLDVEVSELRMKAESSKFNEDRAQQALTTSRAEVLRLGKAVADTEERFGKYRADKQSQISALQMDHDIVVSRLTTAESSYQALQRSYNDQSSRLAHAHADINNLTSAAAARKASSQTELARLVEENRLLSKRAEETRVTVAEREAELERIAAANEEERREADVRVKTEERRRKEAEKRTDELKSVVDRLALGGSDLSPAAALAGEMRQQGKSYTQFFTDYTLQESKLHAAEEEVARLTELLDEISSDIAEKKPLLDEQAAEHAAAIERANALAAELATVMTARDAQVELVKQLTAEATRRGDETAFLQSAADDLSRQVQGLLRQLAIRDDPSLANVPIDAQAAEGDIITDHLLEFKSLRSLQEQNIKLLKTTRALMAKLEQREIRRAADDDVDVSDSLEQATETIDRLHKQLLDASKRLNEATRERDFFGKLLARGEGLKWGPTEDASPHQASVDALRLEIEGVRSKAEEELVVVRGELQVKAKEVGEAEIGRARAEAKASMLEEQARSLTDVNSLEQERARGLETQVRQIQASIQGAQSEARQALEAATLRQAEAERLRADIAVLRAEKEQWQSTESRLQSDFRSVQTERTRLQQLIENLNGVTTEGERTRNEERVRLQKSVEGLQREAVELRSQLAAAREETRAAGQKVADAEARAVAAESRAVAGEAVQTSLTEARDKITKLESEAQRLKTAGLSWKRVSDNMKAELGTANATMESKDKELEAAKTAAEGARTELEQAKKELGEVKTKLQEVEAKLVSVQRAESLKEQTVQRLQSELSGKAAPGTAEKGALQKRVAELEAEVAAKTAAPAAEVPAAGETGDSTKIAELEATIADKEAQIKKHDESFDVKVRQVNNVNQRLKGRVNELLAEIATANARIKELEEKAAVKPEGEVKAEGTEAVASDADGIRAAVDAKVAELNAEHAKALEAVRAEARTAAAGGAGPVDQGAIDAAVAAKEAELRATLDQRVSEAVAAEKKKWEGERDKLRVEVDKLQDKVTQLERTNKTIEIGRRAAERRFEVLDKQSKDAAAAAAAGGLSGDAKPFAPGSPAPAAPQGVKPTPAATPASTPAQTQAGQAQTQGVPATPTPSGPARGRGGIRGGAVRGGLPGRGGAPGKNVLASVNAALAAPSPPAPAAALKRPAPEEGEISESGAASSAAGGGVGAGASAGATSGSPGAAGGGDVLARLQQGQGAARGRIKRPRGSAPPGGPATRRTSQGGAGGAGGTAPAQGQAQGQGQQQQQQQQQGGEKKE